MRNNIVNRISQHEYMQRFHPDSRVPSNSPSVAPDPCPVYTNILLKIRPASLHERASSFCQRTFILVPPALSPAIADAGADAGAGAYSALLDKIRCPALRIPPGPKTRGARLASTSLRCRITNACSASPILRRAPFLASAAKRMPQLSCRDGTPGVHIPTPNYPVPTEKTCWLLMHRHLPLRPTHAGPRPSRPASPVP